MFLEAKTIPGLIANMQRCTKPGGYNLIVAAMDTADYPCTVGFPFAFKEGELRRYYEGWERVKYNEDVGELHRTDANGNRIKLRFATMLARKKWSGKNKARENSPRWDGLLFFFSVSIFFIEGMWN